MGQAVIVLGMHRSGTSALAGTLREAGVVFGRVLEGRSALTVKGLQEAAVLVHMHDDLLARNGAAWDAPPPLSRAPDWGPLHQAVRDLFIEARSGAALWGFKDPRTLLVLDGWMSALPHARLVGVFRDPAEVAGALAHRNGFAADKSYALWTRYNRALLRRHRAAPFPLVEFNRDAAATRAGFASVLKALGLDAPGTGGPGSEGPGQDGAGAFFDAGLRLRHAPPDMPPPQETLEVLGALRARAGQPATTD